MANRLLREVEAAHMLGYTSFSEFRRAVNSGTVPAPSRFLDGMKSKPAWSEQALRDWIDQSGWNEPSSEELLKAIEAMP